MTVFPHDAVRASNAYFAGDLDRAMHLASFVLARNEDDGPMWELRGLIYRDRAQWASCADAIERASLFIPLQPRTRLALAEAYACLDRKELARDLYAAMIDANDATVELLLQTAVLLDAIDQPVLAMKGCQKAIELDPLQSQPYYDMGYYAARCGYRPSVTESLARKAIALDPDRVSYRVGLAGLLRKHHQQEEAFALVQEISCCQIKTIRCRCCLERLESLFEEANDGERAKLSRLQRDWLSQQDFESDCD